MSVLANLGIWFAGNLILALLPPPEPASPSMQPTVQHEQPAQPAVNRRD